MRRPGTQVGPILHGHVMAPAELLDNHRAPQSDLLSLFIAELDAPAAVLIEAVNRIDEVPVEGVAPHLTVGDHVDPGLRLDLDRLVDRAVLETLELGRADLTRLVAAAGLR